MSAKVAAAAGVVTAAAALINGGVDLWKAIFKIPTNQYDEANQKLFRVHFGKTPVLSQPVEIKNASVTTEMLLQVYDSGDLFVRYGDFQQWLPFKAPKSARTLSLFPSAHAQTPAPKTDSSRTDASALDLDKSGTPIVIDIEKLLAAQAAKASTTSRDTRTFAFSELQSPRFSLTKSTQTYQQIFRADPGYTFSDVDFQLGSANNTQVRKVELIEGGKAIRVEYSLTSGPIFDQYRGWIHGTVNARQQPAK